MLKLLAFLLFAGIVLAASPATTFKSDEWREARRFERFISTAKDHDEPAKATSAMVRFDRETLYVAFDCREPDPGKLKAGTYGRDGTLWLDDSVEIFLRTDPRRGDYYHFIINSKGEIFDQLCRPGEVGVHKDWNAVGIKARAATGPDFYRVEVAIPLRNFYFSGDRAMINLARTSLGPKVEYSSASGIKDGFHRMDALLPLDCAGVPAHPGLLLTGVGDRRVGRNLATVTILNDRGATGSFGIRAITVGADRKRNEVTTAITLDGTAEQKLEIPYAISAPEANILTLEMIGQDQVLFTVSRTVNAAEIPVVPGKAEIRKKVWIDEDQALVVDGRKVFPLIFYRLPPSLYGEMRKHGFNAAEETNYRDNFEVFDRIFAEANTAGVGVFPHEDYAARRFLKKRLAEVVRRYRDNSALWVWYLADEPQNYGISPENALDLYRVIRANDPEHPVMVLNSEPPLFAKYAPACDIFAVDCYPVPKMPVASVADYIRQAHAAVEGRKPVWFAAQTFASFSYGGRFPTREELRCMIYLALVNNVKGMLFFAYSSQEMGGTLPDKNPEFYREVLTIADEIQQLAPALTAKAPAQDFRVGDPKLQARLFADGVKRRLIVVNPENRPITAEIAFAGRTRTVNFAPYQVEIITEEK